MHIFMHLNLQLEIATHESCQFSMDDTMHEMCTIYVQILCYPEIAATEDDLAYRILQTGLPIPTTTRVPKRT